ncbi:interleukin-17 receptor E [Syngnathus acus]|uniref:interleukin-17 receptor E n=1 Tax=Syngnathus acus TaxID=161584 RepID=UPI0018861AFC|nr:interleukin-17 receptor E [Syngnathus acus]
MQLQRRFVGSLVFTVIVSGLLLPHGNGNFTCQRAHENVYEADGCPIKIVRHPSNSKCVSVQVWIQHGDLSRAPTIEIASSRKEIIRPVITYKRKKKKWHAKKNRSEIQVWCPDNSDLRGPYSNDTLTSWELLCDCVEAKLRLPVTVSYHAASIRCSVNYTLPDPVPSFFLSVHHASKSINITVESENKVNTRWCYKQSAHNCVQGSNLIIIDPAQSRSALLKIPYMLPCLCIQVFYTHADAPRKTVCPLQHIPLPDAENVWLSSEITPYESTLTWRSVCPAQAFPVFASLCWKHHEHICTPLPNSTLDVQEDGTNLIFNISAVDKHPQMCVKFSLQGSHNISCPFQADMPSWHVSLEAGLRTLSVFVKSSAAATFSAQMCVLSQRECTSRGPVCAVAVEAASESKVSMPLHWAAGSACVQVWQSFPAQTGRRILCPHETRDRWGALAAAALILLTVLAFLAIFLHSLKKKAAIAWLFIQKPVLLVCSSERSSHVSAVCALASLLRGDLSATVHVALCAASSQMRAEAGAETSVADLGPLPWLYGQWEAVQEAQGKVLIIWSPEAKRTYGKWRQRTRGGKDEAGDNSQHDAGRPGMLEEGGAGTCEDKERLMEDQRSVVIEPVFAAALACLEGALHRRKEGGVALVYFRGLCRSRDIPEAFRDIPRYCMPRDLGGLIGELEGPRATNKTFWGRCWGRLLSKGTSVWLAMQLARRLQTLLPNVRRTKGPR